MDSQILRLSAGSLNSGSGDSVIGDASTPLGPGVSKYQGQLGRTIWVPPDQVIYDSSIGTIYGGWFRYVKLRAADAANAIIGHLAFADVTITDWQKMYQVTQDEDLGASGVAGRFCAGVFINTLGYGNYWLIQIGGVVPVKFRGTITPTPVVGSGVYAAALDTGIGVTDNGVADVLAPSSSPVLVTDADLMRQRYLGTATVLPTNGGLTAVALDLRDPFAG